MTGLVITLVVLQSLSFLVQLSQYGQFQNFLTAIKKASEQLEQLSTAAKNSVPWPSREDLSGK